MDTDLQFTSLTDLSGRRALVTGAGKGIGAAISRRFAQAGAHVTMADLDLGSAEQVAAEIRHSGGSAVAVLCDITDSGQLAAAMELADGGHGLHILVNNAGIYPTTGPIDLVTDEFVSHMLDVNVRAQYSAARDAARRMTGGGGSIINLASIAAVRGGANISAYTVSKAAVTGLTRAFANELGRRGIRVNAIAPGIIDTPGVQDQLAPLRAGGLDIHSAIKANPLGIGGQPDHIARVALFLASDMATFVTGQVLVVDGGSTA